MAIAQHPCLGTGQRFEPRQGGFGPLLLIEAEGSVEELQAQLQRLVDDVPLREELCQKGRQRVTENYTQAAIARHTVEVYRQVLGETEPVSLKR